VDVVAVAVGSAHPISPQQVTRRVQLDHKYVGAARARQVRHAGARIEICRAPEVACQVDGPVGGWGDRFALIGLRSAHAAGPNEIAGRPQPHQERIRGSGTRQVQGARPRIEIRRALESARDVHRTVGAEGHAVANIGR